MLLQCLPASPGTGPGLTRARGLKKCPARTPGCVDSVEEHTLTESPPCCNAFHRQCLSTKLDLDVTEDEAKVLVLKFAHEDKPEMVNYVAFSNTIDPPKPWY